MKRRSFSQIFFKVLVHELKMSFVYAYGHVRLAILDEEAPKRYAAFRREIGPLPWISYIRQGEIRTLTLNLFGWHMTSVFFPRNEVN